MERGIDQKYAKLMQQAKLEKESLEDQVKELDRQINELKQALQKIQIILKKLEELLPKILARRKRPGRRHRAGAVDEIRPARRPAQSRAHECRRRHVR